MNWILAKMVKYQCLLLGNDNPNCEQFLEFDDVENAQH
jgi:hypothetical protein